MTAVIWPEAIINVIRRDGTLSKVPILTQRDGESFAEFRDRVLRVEAELEKGETHDQ